MSAPADDYVHMDAALGLAARGLYTADPNPRVGCVIVRGGKVVGEGWHARTGGPHAEIDALEEAGDAARGATAYVTLEPCCHHGRTPPCTDALLAAGIARVVYAAGDPNPAVSGDGARQMTDAGIDVSAGVLEDAARALNVGFFSRMQKARPWVRLKIASSLDGRTALANGASQWITGAPARADVHRLRARSSAILTGVGTVAADNPSMTARPEDIGDVVQPARIVVDSQLNIPVDSKMLAAGDPVRIFCALPDPAKLASLESKGAIVEQIEVAAGRVALPAVMRRLAELEFNELLVEAGPALNGALLEAGLIDELIVYMASDVLGSDARGMFATSELTEISQRFAFELSESRRVGEDLRLSYRPVRDKE